MDMLQVYIGRDNLTALGLEYIPEGETAYVSVPDNAVTRAVFRFGDFCIDTEDGDDLISLTSNETVVEMALGKIADLVTGYYIGNLTIFDALNPDGVAWARWGVHVANWPVCDVVPEET